MSLTSGRRAAMKISELIFRKYFTSNYARGRSGLCLLKHLFGSVEGQGNT